MRWNMRAAHARTFTHLLTTTPRQMRSTGAAKEAADEGVELVWIFNDA